MSLLPAASRAALDDGLTQWARSQVSVTGNVRDTFTMRRAIEEMLAWMGLEKIEGVSSGELREAVGAAVLGRGVDVRWSRLRQTFAGAVLEPVTYVPEPGDRGDGEVFAPVWNGKHELWVVIAADGTGLGTALGGDWGCAESEELAAEIARGLNKAYALGWDAGGGGVDEVTVSCLDCGEEGMRCTNCGGVVAR